MVKKILVSQPSPTSEKSPYYGIEQKYGVEFTFHSFIRVEGLDAPEFRKQRISLGDYNAVLFTSAVAIDHYFALCKALRFTPGEEMRYFAPSEQVALRIQKYTQYRKRKISTPQHAGNRDELLSLMVRHRDLNYLVPQSDVHSDELADALTARRLKHTECVMFRTVPTDYPTDRPFDFDMLVFFTPAGVESLRRNFPEWQQGDTKIVCMGAGTAAAIEAAGLRLDMAAPTRECPSVIKAIEHFL